MKIVSATLLCDRKRSFMLTAFPALFNEPLVDSVYINVESSFSIYEWRTLLIFLAGQNKPSDYDFWDITHSTWRVKPQYDQHQVRLMPIIMGRNMAIDYALSKDATHLLFVDSDVVIHPGGLEKLVALDVPLCGGYVPGRGAHSHVHYVFPGRVGIEDQGDVIACGYGTCGYMLIKREVFEQQRFRWGGNPAIPDEILSEDPAYCQDWHYRTGWPFYVHKEATADHVDDPLHPLTEAETAKDHWNEIQS